MTISMNQLETYGFNAKQIINELDELFPPVNPTPKDKIETIMFRSGQHSVVAWLKQKLEE